MKKKLYKFDIEDEQPELSSEDIEYPKKDMGLGDKYKIQPDGHRVSKKISVVFILISAVIVIFSAWYFYQDIIGPMAFEVPEWIQEDLDEEGREARTIAELQEKDTDEDGLTDYQELYQYHTSMFLPDTDSDGYLDSEEINTGNDPLCPAGEECGILRLITPKTKLAQVVEEVNIDPNLDLQGAVLGNFRDILVNNGVPQEDVDKLTDSDLIELYQLMEERFNSSGEDVDVTNVSPDEVRTFLLSQDGVNEDEVNSLTDEELVAIGQELISGAGDQE